MFAMWMHCRWAWFTYIFWSYVSASAVGHKESGSREGVTFVPDILSFLPACLRQFLIFIMTIEEEDTTVALQSVLIFLPHIWLFVYFKVFWTFWMELGRIISLPLQSWPLKGREADGDFYRESRKTDSCTSHFPYHRWWSITAQISMASPSFAPTPASNYSHGHQMSSIAHRERLPEHKRPRQIYTHVNTK